jgi:hypothetical protein
LRLCRRDFHLDEENSVSFTPRWFHVLPAHIRPAKHTLEKLEATRTQFEMRDDSFLVAVASSPWAVVRAQEATLESLRRQFPDAEEEKLWSAVILSRLEIKLKSPAAWDPPPDELRKQMESVEESMRSIHSWPDVIRYILEMDRAHMAPDTSSPQYIINQLLAQER